MLKFGTYQSLVLPLSWIQIIAILSGLIEESKLITIEQLVMLSKFFKQNNL
jgi:hypothetical protein